MKKNYVVSLYSYITSSRLIFVITCILTIALLIDTSLGRISNFISSNAQGSLLISTFTIIVVTYIIGQYIILEYTNKRIKDINRKNILSNLSKIFRIFQYIISVFLIVVILEIFANSNYHTITLTIIIIFSYGLSIVVTLAILSKHFFSWFISRKSFVVLLYSLSSSVFVLSAVFSLVFVSDIMLKLPNKIQSLFISIIAISYLQFYHLF